MFPLIEGSSSIAPIADLRGVDRYTKQEKILRNKLAALYRLVDLFQWSQGIYNHITVQFLIFHIEIVDDNCTDVFQIMRQLGGVAISVCNLFDTQS